MTDSKHTSAPWIVGIPFRDSQYGVWHCTITSNNWPVMTVNGRTEAECLANAQMAAAAPDLLEIAREAALEPCSTIGLEDLEGGCCKGCRARSALAKAMVAA